MIDQLYIVVAGSLLEEPEETAAALAEVLGLSLFDGRVRARPPAPKVITVTPERDNAIRLANALAAKKLSPMILAGDQVKSDNDRVSVRSFRMASGAMAIESREGVSHQLRDTEILTMIRGTTWMREVFTDTITTRKFDPGKALISGGLMLTSKKKTELTRTELKTEGFILVGTRDGRCFAFRETEIQYAGLGAAMQASRFANFQTICRELRSRAPAAFYDKRLISIAGQNHLLGPMLAPERYLDVAIAVLAAWGTRKPAVKAPTPPA